MTEVQGKYLLSFGSAWINSEQTHLALAVPGSLKDSTIYLTEVQLMGHTSPIAFQSLAVY